MTAKLLWHMQNCDLIKSIESKSQQNYISEDFNYELITVYEMGPIPLILAQITLEMTSHRDYITSLTMHDSVSQGDKTRL